MAKIAQSPIDEPQCGVVNRELDKTPKIVLEKPDLEKIKTARRWLLGASRLLEDAANGDELVDRIAAEAATLANMAEIAVFGHS